ncbi:basic phospholipase A2-like [Carcharodon carcharias]|uniref:basic phospholipase A2-like n=1 Tax=Carcharodon carcharias TaxID=13397 RepID=UPI001B7E0C73|nr:basic phospholipase A2-like [Carcharodon carcharias]
MERLRFIAILLGLGALLNSAQSAATQARGIIQFAAVIHCANPRVNNLRYADYGCFCGFGGNGVQAVDAIDRCCQVHDSCYGEADRMGCNSYIAWYNVICKNEMPFCSYRTWVGPARCGKKLCACDVAAALCFRRHSNKYNPYFANYNQSRCRPRAQ